MQKALSHINRIKGFSLVELLVSVSVFLIFVIAINGTMGTVSKATKNSANRERATVLAEEALEATRNIRDADFANLVDGTYGLSTSGSQWNFSGVSDVSGIFTRVLTISTISPNQKKVDVSISWADQNNPTNSLTSSTYFTNWRAILNVGVGLTVNKSVVNHGGSKVAADFTPYKVGVTTVNVGEANLFPDGTYQVSETVDLNYTRVFSGDCDINGYVTMLNNPTKTCLITNEEKPSYLIVNKVVVNHGLTKVASDFTLLVDTNPVVSGITNTFNSGAHTVSENLDTNYDLTYSGDCNSSGLVTLVPTLTKVCTLTNTEKLAYITVNKIVLGGPLSISSFAPFKVGITTVSQGVATAIDSGTYTITETTSSDYTQTFSGDCNASGIITLVSGQSKVCTITNTYNTNGILIYGDGTTIPKYRNYNKVSDTFTSEASALTASTGQTFVVRTSPAKKEAIAGFITSTGVLNIMCYDGASWSQEWTATVGGTGTTRKFDIAYETNSGDVMVAYSRNTTSTNDVNYRTKLGSAGCGSINWSAALSIPTSSVITTGNTQWIKIKGDPRVGSNIISLAWADINSDLGVAVWSGSAWSTTNLKTLETALEIVSVAQDVDSFDISFESVSGNLMAVWGSGGTASTNGAWYNRCVGGTSACTWTAARTAIPTMANDATNLDISSNPNTNEIVFGSIGNAGSDLQAAYWSGSAWTGQNDIDISTQVPVAGTKLVSTGWLISGATTRSVVVYNDSGSTNIGYYTGVNGVFTVATDFVVTPVFASPQKTYQVEMDPLNKNQLMFCLSDNASDLFCKRLVMSATPVFTWTNSDGGVAIELTLSQIINSPFSYAFWRQ